MMATNQDNAAAARVRAEERFRVREQRATDADQAMRDIAVARDAERAKTERLRALRLAKEEADRVAAAAAPAPVKKTRAAAPRVRSKASAAKVESV